MMVSRISFVTLGVSALDLSARFYGDGLGLARKASPPGVRFFSMGETTLALYPRVHLAADAGVPAEGGGFAGFALACNVESAEAVDGLLARAARHGGRLVKSGGPTGWGGHAGYFADPDGFLWEVAFNPRLAR